MMTRTDRRRPPILRAAAGALAAVALLALFGALALPLQAQTPPAVRVSNLGQTDRVNGTATDATLSGLVVNDGTKDLTPTFASGTYAYAGSVANTVAEVTVTPTENDTTATIEYLDASDMMLADSDTLTAGQQVTLAVGGNVIKVKVTAEDGTTEKTNTVTVTREGTVETDRAALVALYNSTGGANWKSNANWGSNRPIGEWHGVTTDGNGRVTWLYLHDNQLTGEIPPELGGLSNLTETTS